MTSLLRDFGKLHESRLSLLRLDLPDALAGGNKSFKLKYTIEAMKGEGKNHLLSFGGAFSNHIAALAAAGKKYGFATTGIIRGEELHAGSNPVLRFASSCGMKLLFVSREEYRLRNDPAWLLRLGQDFPDAYVLPEGGSNALAVKGCMEILTDETAACDHIFCPVGTGATLAGIIAAATTRQQVTGIAVLEGKHYLEEEVRRHLAGYDVKAAWSVNGDFTFGGYAKKNEALEDFIRRQSFPLDPVYSGKAFYALHEIAKGDAFAGKHLLFVHTGGYAFYKPG